MKRAICAVVMGLLLVIVSADLFGTASTALKYRPVIPVPHVIAAAETTYAWVMSDSLINYTEVPEGTVDITFWTYAKTLSADSLIVVIRVSPDPGQFGQVIDSLSITASAGYDYREYGDSSKYWGLTKYIQVASKIQDQHSADAVVYNTYVIGITYYDKDGKVIKETSKLVYDVFNRKNNDD